MEPLHLRSAGTSVVIDFSNDQAQVLHWGADLGKKLPELGILTEPVPHSSLDVPVTLSLVPQGSAGWRGRPGLLGHTINGGQNFSPAFRVTDATASTAASTITQVDATACLELVSTVRLHPGGLLEVTHRLTNQGPDAYSLEQLAVQLPVPGMATELLDLTGRWCRERHPQRRAITQGTWVRSGRHGRTGHDSSLIMAAGTPGFSHEQGQVWAVHFAWSGNHEEFCDTAADGRTVLGAAELLGPGEVTLAPGESYTTPAMFAAYSESGLNGISRRFYDWFRARDHHVGAWPDGRARPRPAVLNVWEAVYFDHNLEKLTALAQTASEVGIERFVLDDGWFRGRRDDSAGLGDWFVDEGVWPDGLTPLINEVSSRGMEFGLWVEPEMVNLNSDLIRAHPDWVAGPYTSGSGARLPLEWRQQHVLDLVNPEAWQYIFDRLDALLTEYNISYLKWDQNRDLIEHGHAGSPSVHEQTLAVYRLLDALRAAHPGVEIESCSSGGARVDLEILEHTDRIWTSDCNDALERQTIQAWTQLVVPPELVGSHVGPTQSHTTARTHSLAFRAITALFGHFGLEWDISTLDCASRAELAFAIALYKKHRALIHSGDRVYTDAHQTDLNVYGVAARGGRQALFAVVSTTTAEAEQPGRVQFPGLDPEREYRVRAVYPRAEDGSFAALSTQRTAPAWFAQGATASGRFLGAVGLPAPILNPEQGFVVEIRGLD
ncbi:alpha-galactosidase [Pseudarthrobacter sp. J1763]|uniref:alpha-galactosidase n=1 Tax=Pseudarthrobacter sp. J1763 TaxID=3420445 RepID=UPI003D28471A